MIHNIHERPKVVYPTSPDVSIVVGDKVRSFDYKDNSQCYWVGTVTSINSRTGPFGQYDIQVDYQVWEGRKQKQNYCASIHIPLNGRRGPNGVFMGVQKVKEGEEE